MKAEVTISKRHLDKFNETVKLWNDDAGLATVKQIGETETDLVFEIDAYSGQTLFYMGNSFGMGVAIKIASYA